jgi:ParB-like chromosome segregation protein Spo0J
MEFPDYKMVSVDSLIPYARNSRTHSNEQVAQIAASIREFGFLNPIIVDGSNGIIAGHGRVLAAQKLKIDQLPCIEASHLTEAQRKAYVIADNKLALNAGWDDELLQIELGELKDLGFDVTITGFSLEEISKLDEADGDNEQGELDGGIDYQEKYSVVVECKDEGEQAALFEQLSAMGLSCKVLVN